MRILWVILNRWLYIKLRLANHTSLVIIGEDIPLQEARICHLWEKAEGDANG
jgi:hypothetical protein